MADELVSAFLRGTLAPQGDITTPGGVRTHSGLAELAAAFPEYADAADVPLVTADALAADVLDAYIRCAPHALMRLLRKCMHLHGVALASERPHETSFEPTTTDAPQRHSATDVSMANAAMARTTVRLPGAAGYWYPMLFAWEALCALREHATARRTLLAVVPSATQAADVDTPAAVAFLSQYVVGKRLSELANNAICALLCMLAPPRLAEWLAHNDARKADAFADVSLSFVWPSFTSTTLALLNNVTRALSSGEPLEDVLRRATARWCPATQRTCPDARRALEFSVVLGIVALFIDAAHERDASYITSRATLSQARAKKIQQAADALYAHADQLDFGVAKLTAPLEAAIKDAHAFLDTADDRGELFSLTQADDGVSRVDEAPILAHTGAHRSTFLLHAFVPWNHAATIVGRGLPEAARTRRLPVAFVADRAITVALLFGRGGAPEFVDMRRDESGAHAAVRLVCAWCRTLCESYDAALVADSTIEALRAFAR